MNELEGLISSYKPISLQEMDAVALMNRVDTKYVVSRSDAISVLAALSGAYQVLEVEEKRLFPYRTVYFDTDDRFLLHQHLRGKLNREKIRSREYVDTDARFFELKRKTNKGRTLKKRIKKVGALETMFQNDVEFLHPRSAIKPERLIPVMQVLFSRITLVNLPFKERVTFDAGLQFSDDNGRKGLDDLVIIEVKRDSETASRTLVSSTLKMMHARPMSISKYCIGMILLGQTTFYNPYKSKLLQLNKISAHANIW